MEIRKTSILISFWIFFCSFSGQAQNTATDTQFFTPGNLSQQNDVQTNYAPSTSQLGLQFGSGALFGAAGVFVGGFTGYAANGFKDDHSSIGPLLLGTSTGYLFGSALGVYLVANSHSYDASYSSILLGNIAGAGIGLGVMAYSDNHIDNQRFVSIFALSSVIIGGMIANKFSITKRSNSSSPLLNITNGVPQLSTPSVKMAHIGNDWVPNPKNGSSFSPTIKLLNISL